MTEYKGMEDQSGVKIKFVNEIFTLTFIPENATSEIIKREKLTEIGVAFETLDEDNNVRATLLSEDLIANKPVKIPVSKVLDNLNDDSLKLSFYDDSGDLIGRFNWL